MNWTALAEASKRETFRVDIYRYPRTQHPLPVIILSILQIQSYGRTLLLILAFIHLSSKGLKFLLCGTPFSTKLRFLTRSRHSVPHSYNFSKESWSSEIDPFKYRSHFHMQ